jgi:hypothetical protein
MTLIFAIGYVDGLVPDLDVVLWVCHGMLLYCCSR